MFSGHTSHTFSPDASNDGYHHSNLYDHSKSHCFTRQSHGTSHYQVKSFAQSVEEDNERFYETFPNAKAAHAAHLVSASSHFQQQQQHWSTQQLGGDYGLFHGDFVFYYSQDEAPSSSALSPDCYLQLPASSPEARPYPKPPHSSHLSYLPPHSSQLYDHPHAHVEGQHDAGSLYALGESVASGDVNESQDYAPVPVAPYTDNSAQRHLVVSSSVEPMAPFQSHESEQLPGPTYHDSLHPAVPTIETPVVDYLLSPESPQSIYSPVDAANLHHISAEPMPAEPVPASPSQPIISSSSPLPPQANFEAETSRVSEKATLHTNLGPFTKTLSMRKRRRTSSEGQHSPPAEAGRSYVYKIPLPKPNHVLPPKVPKRRASTPQTNEKKNLALACFFCRGRKIACGPHDPNSSDRTCAQCYRRGLKCDYPTESRRGMRKKKDSISELPAVPAKQAPQDLGALGSGSP